MAESRRDEIAKLEALYASNPDGRVFTHLAEAYRRAGELDRARDILDRGLQRHPDYPSAHVVLGRVYADLGREEDAVTSFRRVLELDPENLIARRSLAEAARAAGHDEDALLHYRELLQQDPSAAEVREIVTELETRLHGPPPAPPPIAQPSWSASRDEQSWDTPEPAIGGAAGGFGETGPIEPPAFGDVDLGGSVGQATPEPAEPAPSPFDPVPLDLSGIDFGGAGAAAAPSGETEQPAADHDGGIDFGGPTAPPEPFGEAATPEPSGETEQPAADHAYDATGWGEWPAAAGAGAEGVDEDESAELTAAENQGDAYAIEPLEPAGAAHGHEDMESLGPPEAKAAGYAGESTDATAAGYAGESTDATEPVYTGEPEPFAGRPTVEAPLEQDAGPATVDDQDTGRTGDQQRFEPDHAPAADRPHAAEQHAGPGDYGVPTETLATLYEAQGFPDRAAAVYRALLRDRPDDERLRERARAAEEAAAALRAERTGIEETREVWLSGTTDSWDSGDQPRTAYAWQDDEEDDEPVAAGPSIGEYLQRVLSWHPAETEGVAGTDTAAEDAPQPWHTADISAPGPDEPLQPWDAAEPEAAARDEVIEPWETRAEEEDTGDLDTIDGFVFSGEPAAEAAPAPESGMEIEYGYGLAPGESAFGAHPPAEREAGETDVAADWSPEGAGEERAAEQESAEEPFVFEDASEPGVSRPFGARHGDSGLHLDTLLPLPPEDEVAEEQPTTWFEPAASHDSLAAREPPPFQFEESEAAEEPVAEALPFDLDEPEAAEEPVAGPLPFDLDEPDTGPDGPVAEPLPFDFEQIGTDPGAPAAEPLPFDLAALGADVDDEPGEPLPFELSDADAAPWAQHDAGGQEPAPVEEPDDGMLELHEAEAVNEAPEPVMEGWDPTIALADVEPVPHARPEPRLRVEGGARPEPPAAERSRPPQEEEEDEDLEMFRSWLQSLKR